MAKEPKQLDELFHDTLKDIYYAEKKILSALPKMAKAAQNEDLESGVRKASRGDRGTGVSSRTGVRDDRREAPGQEVPGDRRHH